MDWKTFTSNMTTALAWPTVIGCLAFCFRSEIQSFLKNIRKLGAAGINLEVAELIEQSGERLNQSASPRAEKHITKKDYALVEVSPEGAVLQSYEELSDVLLKLRSRLPDDRPHRTLIEVVNWLTKAGHVSSSIRESFLAMQRTVNLVRHDKGPDRISRGEAIEIIRQLDILVEVFEGVLDRLSAQAKRA